MRCKDGAPALTGHKWTITNTVSSCFSCTCLLRYTLTMIWFAPSVGYKWPCMIPAYCTTFSPSQMFHPSLSLMACETHSAHSHGLCLIIHVFKTFICFSKFFVPHDILSVSTHWQCLVASLIRRCQTVEKMCCYIIYFILSGVAYTVFSISTSTLSVIIHTFNSL